MSNESPHFSHLHHEAIHRVNGYDKDAYNYIPVVIIGAGESGIALGCQLKEKLGFDQFRIFERQAGVGGTWWINRYPGVACDIPAVFYSFSFAPNPKWSSFFPGGPEIVKYLQSVCQKYEIADKIELNSDVTECKWLDGEKLWQVTIRYMKAGMGDLSSKDRLKKIQAEGEDAVYTHSEIVKAKIVVSGVGGLVEPKALPDDVKGFDTFQGKTFHSARWDYNVDLKDKDVVVVGTGCSAAQLVPEITKAPFHAKSVTQIMRSPPWVMPALAPPGGAENWKKYAPKLFSNVPGLLRLIRYLVFTGAEAEFQLFGDKPHNEARRQRYEKALLKYMRKIVPEKYHASLTPDYGVGCKRRIIDSKWFQSLNDPKIELTTRTLTEVKNRSVVLGADRSDSKAGGANPEPKEIPADVLILANGFDTTRWLHPLKVTGRAGADLVETMESRGGPQAYQGTAMDGFPNFFIIFGPNTATGHSSVILATENMIMYALNFIGPVLRREVETVEVRREAEERYTREIQGALGRMVWASGGCRSWYSNDGWNGTTYPYSQYRFYLQSLVPKYTDWDITYTPLGLRRRRMRILSRSVIFVAVVVGLWKWRRSGLGMKGGLRVAVDWMIGLNLRVVDAVQDWVAAL
ncbi:FAD/NAD(P)-binding domain-containing protein [Aulographum hederae CBS 113979]|uniref:FAD/NAD(P)-binding domain-containing protein n=1 Tax=Aulographum hederae CBS 113979 TaxID=1176131 RepID=A0A6G1H8C3_9PEZI|nr:FAD/NAD(P)-binding domain-containing protein [Aulographum hederae CBS 113979]